MRNRWTGVAAAIGLTLLATPIGLTGQTSLSIYSDGRVVVRRTLPQTLQKGHNLLTLQLGDLDPATLFSPDTAVTVAGATVRFPTDKSGALGRAVGQTMSFVKAKGDTVRATVVSVDPPQYRLSDGRLLLVEPGEPLFPAELVRSTPEAAIALDATRARPNTQVAYLTTGVRWEATYQAIIGAGQATISGAATIRSDSLHTDSADAQLVAGTINRAREPQTYRLNAIVVEGMAARQAAAPMAQEQTVGETHVYSLPAKVVLEPGVASTIALFPHATVKVVQEFIVPGVLPWRGYLGPMPTDPNQVPVGVWFTFARSRGTPLGDRPLPGGTVQLYQADDAGRLQLIGEATIGHTPAGKDVRVQSGDAFDVTAERVQTDFNQEQIPPAKRGLPARQRITAAYRVTITNAKTDTITVDVRENHFGTWRILESSVPAEKLSSTESRFRVKVPPSGQAELTYTLQVES
jgi:hypothetical protein